MARRCLVFVLFLFFFLPVLAVAEDLPGSMPRLFGTFAPEAGVWSKYEVLEKDSGRKSTMTMAIVGQEENMFWYEVINEDGISKNIVRMLVKDDPNDPENIQRLILKSGENPAQEMPRDFVIMGRRMADYMFEKRSGLPTDPSLQLKLQEIGKNQVTVTAGSFDVTTNQIVDAAGKSYGTYNFSDKVKPFGVVNADSSYSSMELLAYGTNARSAITEIPLQLQKLPGMPDGMPQGMPQGFPPGMGSSPAPATKP